MKTLSIVFCLLTVFVFGNLENREISNGHDRQIPAEDPQVFCERPNIPFIVFYNELHSENVRHIKVFLSDKKYSIENVKKISLYLNGEFPSPKHLTVVIYTDWSQLDLPNDCQASGIAGETGKPSKDDFLWAVFNRSSMAIRHLKTPGVSEFETMSLK